MKLTMLEAMGAKRLNREELLRLCDEKTSWTTSASGPGGHNVRVTSKKGATPQEIANDIAVAASRLASREQREGLSRKRTLQSADDQHKASSSGTLTGYGVSERMSVCLGFAEAFGASDDVAPAIEANILKDCAPVESNTSNSRLSHDMAQKRKAVAIARVTCLHDIPDSDRELLMQSIVSADWTDIRAGDELMSAIKDESELYVSE